MRGIWLIYSKCSSLSLHYNAKHFFSIYFCILLLCSICLVSCYLWLRIMSHLLHLRHPVCNSRKQLRKKAFEHKWNTPNIWQTTQLRKRAIWNNLTVDNYRGRDRKTLWKHPVLHPDTQTQGQYRDVRDTTLNWIHTQNKIETLSPSCWLLL